MTARDLHGVNLGGWLVLERWMTPSLFDGLQAQDEYSLCVEVGAAKSEKLQRHRATFITKSDFGWLAAHDVNTIRIPLGHWIFDGQEPYVAAIDYLDRAMEWTHEFGLKVILDFHAAPGSQNGWDHSGKAGEIEWYKNPEYINRSLDVVEQLAERYKSNSCLYGIELLNEPHWTIPLQALIDYYQAGYERVRKHCNAGVSVILCDAFRPLETWKDVMPEPEFANVILDTHLYQVFKDEYKTMTLEEHLERSAEWQKELEQFSALRSIIVGEWSLAVASKAYEGLSEAENTEAHKKYATSQLAAFQTAAGNFFWNYKTETPDEWNYRNCYEKGYFTWRDLIA